MIPSILSLQSAESADAQLDVIVPVSIELDWPTEADVIRDILELNRKYGFRRFALSCPGAGWRSIGFPPMEHFRKLARFFRRVRLETEPCGIECGWWITLTLKSGPDSRWNRMVRMDGTETPMASCPLNPVFRETFARSIAEFVKIARPAFTLTEDDFSINAAATYEGCFCSYHLAEFTRRQGRPYTREELKAVFEKKTPDALQLIREWRILMRDSLADFAGVMRGAVDKVAPETPMGTAQAGNWDHDGDATETVTRAMAGKNHIPFCRFYGSIYGGEIIHGIPVLTFHALYSRQHTRRDLRYYHECDTFPHTRFFTSAASLRVITTAACSFGCDGLLFYTQQILDDPNEEDAYSRMFAEECRRFETISAAARQCLVKGVRVHLDPFWASIRPEMNSGWIESLGAFGIPVSSLPAGVTFLSGTQPESFSDTELKELLSSSLILDGDAALCLQERGHGDCLGVKVEENPITGMEQFDLGGREVIEPAFIPECRGRHMHRADFFAPRGRGSMHELIPQDSDCEIISRTVTFQQKPVGVAMTRFRNRLGGKIVVMGMGVCGNYSSSLLNYRRQWLIQEQVIRCSDEFVMVRGNARVYIIMNEAANPAGAGFAGMLTLTNISPDDLDSVTLHLPPEWRKFGIWQRLDPDGRWGDFPYSRRDDTILLEIPLRYARPEVLLVKQ